MRQVELYFKQLMKWLELDDSKYATLTEADCARNSYPLSTVRNVTVMPSLPDSTPQIAKVRFPYGEQYWHSH